jgi:subtilisin family serine protease
VDFPAAWEMGYDGRACASQVIDSGVYAGHEDLAAPTSSGCVNVNRPRLDTGDTRGHGTFIIAMLAAGRNNGLGISGMVDRASIVPIKCFSESQQTDSQVLFPRHIYGCCRVQLRRHQPQPRHRHATCRFAPGRWTSQFPRVIIVASAGNTAGTALVYPAAYPSVVGVRLRFREKYVKLFFPAQ